MRALYTFCVLFVVTLYSNSCVSSGNRAELVSPEVRDGKLLVRVENRNWSDARIYAVCGAYIKLGTVSSFARKELDAPRGCVYRNDFRLRVTLIGSSDEYVTSDPILAGPGDIVEFTVFNNLIFSTVIVITP